MYPQITIWDIQYRKFIYDNHFLKTQNNLLIICYNVFWGVKKKEEEARETGPKKMYCAVIPLHSFSPPGMSTLG